MTLAHRLAQARVLVQQAAADAERCTGIRLDLGELPYQDLEPERDQPRQLKPPGTYDKAALDAACQKRWGGGSRET